ncbi:uncharacterized protein LOC113146792, partial [Cyclospora cayetanensis]|uniref:Mitochondrial import inner membrane translocase subunit TIM50 n=1 Tax=Cyclospora cayetanensis TaxID=88456 RepID=A0A6P6RV06_9EIME
MLGFICECIHPLQQQLQWLLLLLLQEWPAAVATGLCAYAAQTLLQGLPFFFGCMRDYPSPLAFYSWNLLRLLRRRRSSGASNNNRWKRDVASSPLQHHQHHSACRLLGVQHVAPAAASGSPDVSDAHIASCRSSSSLSSSNSGRQKLGGRQRTRPPMTLAVDLDETLVLSTQCKLFASQKSVPMRVSSGLVTFQVAKRPHADYFLQELYDLYEIVIFTASRQEYAHAVLDATNLVHYVDRVFSRSDCILTENFVPIGGWFGSEADEQLLCLLPLLHALRAAKDLLQPPSQRMNGQQQHKQQLLQMRRQERLGLTPQQAKEQELQRPHLRFRQQEQQSICPPTLSLAAIDACRRAVGTAQAFVAATPQLVGELQQLWQQRMGRCMA